MDVYCPNCEFRCSQGAESCPKCGHRLGQNRYGGDSYLEVWALRILGLVLLAAGVCIMVWALTGAWEMLVGGAILLSWGLVIRSLGGIWATLERIAGK